MEQDALFGVVPNFSEGRRAHVIDAIVEALRVPGARVVYAEADPDHNRLDTTVLGSRDAVAASAMAGAAGINTERVDALTFALGCGLAGIAGSSFTMLASTGPVTGQQYVVDTFIVVVFGGVENQDSWRRSVEYRDRPTAFFSVPIHIRQLGSQQPVCLLAYLV